MNAVEKAKVYSEFLDSVVKGLTSRGLDGKPSQFNGGGSVEIATVTTSGMTNYDRQALGVEIMAL